MSTSTFQIDDSYSIQVDDLCKTANHMMAYWKNKLYAIGGYNQWISESGEQIFASDSQLRILDFTKSVNLTRHDPVTSFYRLGNDVPRIKWGNVFVANGKLRMFGGEHEYYDIMDENGDYMTDPELRPDLTNKIWTVDLETKHWEVGNSGMQSTTAGRTSVAYDEKNEVGWMYGGLVQQEQFHNGTVLQESNPGIITVTSLYRLDSDKPRPEKVTTEGNPGIVQQGQMEFIEGAGEAGILVLIGGQNGPGDNTMRSMQTVDVYDIASQTWFKQTTTADRGVYPNGRMEFCSVVASAEDSSSHNIYIHGGWDLKDPLIAESDIFVLSIPAFHWVSVGTDDATYTRSHHKCARVQEKYMIVYRGALNGGEVCDKGAIHQGISVFDMSLLEWTTRVDVVENQKYSVPEPLYKIIGGSTDGEANFTTPQKGFDDKRLAAIFQTKQTFTDTNNATDTTKKTSETNKSLPTGAIVGGVVGGLILIALALLAFCCIKKRRNRRYAADHAEMVTQYPAWPYELPQSGIEPQEMAGYGPNDIPPSRELHAPEYVPSGPKIEPPKENDSLVYGTYYGARS